MGIDYLTWTRVRAGGSPPTCVSKTASENVSGLLETHLENLRGRVRNGTTPPAEFVASEARTRFEVLRDGSEAEFLAAATEIAQDLVSKMDKRTDPGILVALRRSNDGGTEAAVLKMEVTDPFAGYIRKDPTEGEVLDAVRNLLDTPGHLQKGAVFPDVRSGSEVVVGDRLAATALYFLDALGIRQVEKPSHAVAGVMRVVEDVVPERAQDVAALLQDSSAKSVASFVEEIPDLTQEVRGDLVARAEARRRPIRELDPTRSKSLKKILRVSGLTISGRVADMDRVKVKPRDDGGYRITIDVDEKPDVEYK